jgi:hypothetical protein
MYKVIIIDAVDKCIDLRAVSLLIRLILEWASEIPFKIFIASCDEIPICKAFLSKSNIREDFYLHKVEKDVVKGDIHKYLKKSLFNIRKCDPNGTLEEWPSPSELSALVNHSGTLFIYVATSVRYIDDENGNYQDCMLFMISSSSTSGSILQTALVDELYVCILGRAYSSKEPCEVLQVKKMLATIIFLQTLLSIKGITSLLAINGRQLSALLSPLKSVIHVPTHEEAPVMPFHASFPDFVTNPACCSPECCHSIAALVASEGHKMLALKCLEHMNCSLKYNICKATKELTVSHRGTTNSPENAGKISEALKYSCLFLASHLAEVQVFGIDLIAALHGFLHQHILHWMKCLSAVSELPSGFKSLRSAATTLLVSDSLE